VLSATRGGDGPCTSTEEDACVAGVCAGVCTPSGSGGGGAGGTEGDGGQGDGDQDSGDEASLSGGCGCRTGGAPADPGAWVGLGVLVALARRREARRAR
jgi:MYXO-CTERM domain-containing protein